MTVESSEFTRYVNIGAFLAHERQMHLNAVLEGHTRWEVDLEAGVVRLHLPGRVIEAQAQVIGSSSQSAGSWMWAWANPSLPEGVTKIARNLRDIGIQHSVPELSEAQRPLGPHGNETPGAFWFRLTAALGALCASWSGFFRAPTGEGTVAPILLNHADFALPPIDLERFLRVLSETRSTYAMTDERTGLQGYAQRRGIPIQWPGREALVTLPQGVLRVDFDDANRITTFTPA